MPSGEGGETRVPPVVSPATSAPSPPSPWYRNYYRVLTLAQAQEWGIVVETERPHQLRELFCNLRLRKSMFARFNDLTFVCQARYPTQLWIIKKCQKKKIEHLVKTGIT